LLGDPLSDREVAVDGAFPHVARGSPVSHAASLNGIVEPRVGTGVATGHPKAGRPTAWIGEL
jgi:hypothetical protein